MLYTAAMQPGQRQRWRIFLGVVLGSVIVSAIYGGLVSIASGPPFTLVRGLLTGIIQGGVVSAIIAGSEIFGTRTPWGRLLEQAPFLVTVGVKGVLYGAVISAVVAGELGARVLGRRAPLAPAENPTILLSIAFSFMMTFLVIFVLEMSRIVGGRTLAALVLGRYHRPQREERFFLFVDIAGSTPLAERIGPAAVHRFLDRVFRVASDPIDDHDGEIYQYVGDEMVITWTAGRGRLHARPVACFFAIEAALARAAPGFERDFGTTPRVRGALHAGSVVSGEVGESRRAIVFHGDAVNTTSRIEQATRDLGRRFLASGDALERLALDDHYALEDLGPQRLRGREAPVRVFAVDAKRE